MAVAPLNKFITVAVPVAPGIQTVYTTPVGVSAIVLYCGVANVAVVSTFPKVISLHIALLKSGLNGKKGYSI